MSRVFVRDLSDGDRLQQVLLVRNKQTRSNRNGNPYLQLELMDRSGTLDARFWNVKESVGESINAGDFIEVRGKVQLFQGQLQLIIDDLQRSEPAELNLADFLPATDKNIDSLLTELRGILNTVKDQRLRAITEAFLIDDEFVRRFAKAPAGVRNHHAYIGGLLEHVVNMLQTARRIADLYPSLNHDLLLVGIFLHDAGKIRELEYTLGFSYSDEGQLLGHLVIGVEMLAEKLPIAQELLGEPIPPSLVRQLKHLIVSHHGQYEFGSPRLPMTPEAIALHHLDNLDAKVHNFSQSIRNDPDSASAWTAYDASLGRRLYKGEPAVGGGQNAPATGE